MSTYEQRDNSGSIFKNRKREKDTHPNATGTAMIGGVKYYVSAWTKTDKNGNPWQSLSFKQVDEAERDNSHRPAQQTSYADQLNDDIPF